MADSLRARTAILARLRAAVAGAPVHAPDLDTYDRDENEAELESLTEQFIQQARAWQAEIIETTVDEWPERLDALLRARRISTPLAGRNTPIAGILAERLSGHRLRWYDRTLAEWKQELFDTVDAGITTTTGAVAATGGVLLQPGIEEPRTLSLVPPTHIAILHQRDIHATLAAALRAQQWARDTPSNLLMVSGPSKTADIQRMLVYGAHGPKALVILLLRDPSPGDLH